MLYFEISGYRSRAICQDVVEWFVVTYLPRYHLDIHVLHRGLKREGVMGLCTVEDCDYRPRAFLIELHNRLDKDTYVRTLLHELWHVYQHVKGDLRDKRSKRLWKGLDHSDTEYDNKPWEIEAQSMEKTLQNHYEKQISLCST